MSVDVKHFRTQAISKNLLILNEEYKNTPIPQLLNMDFSYQKGLAVDFVYKSWGIVYLSDEEIIASNWRARVVAAKKYTKPVLLLTRSSSIPDDLFNEVQFFTVENKIKVISIFSQKQLIRVITNITRDKHATRPLSPERFNPEDKYRRNFKLQQTVMTIPGVEALTSARVLLETFQTIQSISKATAEELKNSKSFKHDQGVSLTINFFKSNETQPPQSSSVHTQTKNYH